MDKQPKLLVVGSLVMDLIVSSSVFPKAGETVLGKSFSTAPGGKGANQALQAARLGADVTLVGMVGDDDFGKRLRKSAEESGVNTQWLFTTDKAPTAVGNVQIREGEQGTENRIIVVPGANHVLTEADVAFLKDHISQYDMVILQLEIALSVNTAVAAMAKAASVPVFLNPAPYCPLPQELLSCLTYICPNEHEGKGLTGVEPTNEETVRAAAEVLRSMGIPNVLITLGKQGSYFSGSSGQQHSRSAEGIIAADPTAAGDSFIGAFCTAVTLGISPAKAMEFANCAAGITVSRLGAQPSLPTLTEVLSLMRNQGMDTTPYEALNRGKHG